MIWIVMCRVSRGVTGTRIAPLKRDGVLVLFDSEADAVAEASRLTETMNADRYRTATFQYWAEAQS